MYGISQQISLEAGISMVNLFFSFFVLFLQLSIQNMILVERGVQLWDLVPVLEPEAVVDLVGHAEVALVGLEETLFKVLVEARPHLNDSVQVTGLKETGKNVMFIEDSDWYLDSDCSR